MTIQQTIKSTLRTLLPEMTTWVYARGYVLVSVEPGYVDPRSGQLLQMDGIFHRFRD